ncbi:hypothetical protein JCM18918_1303 [Cutibacterium acnes JCM 18918]|nr:hypothetical protein JCM18918_1303 [Cutibacterium acnes JCM 18918]
MQDAHGVDDADAVNWTVPLASESLDDSTGDMREQGDDTPRNAAFMDEGTDMEREKKRASTHAVDVFEDSRSIVIM